MANGGHQPSGPPGQRHAGVVHGGRSRRPAAAPRRDWLAAGIVAGFTVLLALLVVSVFNGHAADVAPTSSPTFYAVSSLSIFVQETPAATATPTAAPGPTATPTLGPTPTPTTPPTLGPTLLPSTSAPPTLTSSATSSPLPSLPPSASSVPPPSSVPEPTAPAYGLVIVEPANGYMSLNRSLLIRGLAQPGATITRDVPMWFDEHTVADSEGRWSFIEGLNIGQNTFMFRVGDDTATEVTLTVYYLPQ